MSKRLEFSRKVRRAIIDRAAGPVFMVQCSHCAREFDRGYKISAKRAANPQYCSPECRHSAIAMTEEEAIASLRTRLAAATIMHGDGRCWGWRGRKNSTGYGLIDYRGKPRLAHRVSYFLHTGNSPDDLYVCHSCDNPECTNPAHLWLGTHQDNMSDASAKDRMKGGPRGSQVGSSKLSEADVIAIRSSDEPAPKIAADYAVTKEAVYAIRSRKNWGWLRG